MTWADSQLEVALRVIEQDYTPSIMLYNAGESDHLARVWADHQRWMEAFRERLKKGPGSAHKRPNLDQGDDNRE